MLGPPGSSLSLLHFAMLVGASSIIEYLLFFFLPPDAPKFVRDMDPKLGSMLLQMANVCCPDALPGAIILLYPLVIGYALGKKKIPDIKI